MKEFIESMFKTTNERIKNPFIGAFLSAWLIFNWRPLLYLIFSSQNIECKIFYIEKQFNNKEYLLIYPLISAIFYILVLPLINLLFDTLLKSTIFKRNALITEKRMQAIENEKIIAIEEIKLEEAKTEYRGLKNQNKLIEELQQKCIKLEDEISNEKDKALSESEKLKNEFNQKEEQFKLEIKKFEIAKFESLSELVDLRSKVESLEENNKILNQKLHEFENNIESIIKFKNGDRYIEQIINGEKNYFNIDKTEIYSPEEIIKRMNENEYEKIQKFIQ